MKGNNKNNRKSKNDKEKMKDINNGRSKSGKNNIQK
jgi:hypothetical protein